MCVACQPEILYMLNRERGFWNRLAGAEAPGSLLNWHMRKILKCSLVSARIAVTPREGTAPCGVTCDFAFFAPFPGAASGAQGPCYSGPPVLSGPWRCARGLGAMASYKNCASIKAFKLVLNIIIEKAQNTEIDQYGYLMYACRPRAGAVARQRRCTATVFA